MTKSSPRVSVLKRQKPLKKKNKAKSSESTTSRKKRAWLVRGALAFIVITALGLAWQRFNPRPTPLSLAWYKGKNSNKAANNTANNTADNTAVEPPLEWQVGVRMHANSSQLSHTNSQQKAHETTDTNAANNEAIIQTTIQTVATQLGKGDRAGLTRAAQAVQKLASFSRVHILRLGENRVEVELKLREPVLCIEIGGADANRRHYVSEDAEVFGKMEDLQVCPGPTLSGVLSSQRNLTLADDFTLSLKDEEKALIKEALDLVRAADEQNFRFTTINYKRYRGFFAVLSSPERKDAVMKNSDVKDGKHAGDETEVALGRMPFVDKLNKLAGILAKLDAKGDQAQRIELDYQGKAFVKLRKL